MLPVSPGAFEFIQDSPLLRIHSSEDRFAESEGSTTVIERAHSR